MRLDTKNLLSCFAILAIWTLSQAQEIPSDATWCYETFPNGGPDDCNDAVGTPVCGYYTLRCLIPPCDVVQYNYANPCLACIDNMDSYTTGACSGPTGEEGEGEGGAEEGAAGETESWICENGEGEIPAEEGEVWVCAEP